MKKLRIGIIGCGRIAVLHFDAVANSDRAELVSCADIVVEKAQKYAEEYHINAYSDYSQMFAKEQLDAVHICLPHYLHTKVAIEAMEAGLDVLVEKPMDINMARAKEAVEASKALGRVYGVISQSRYTPSAMMVKEAVKSGKLGKILSVRSVVTWKRTDAYYDEDAWRGTWDMEGGGVVINQAIHSVDLVRWIVDSELESMDCAIHKRNHPTIEVEDVAEGMARFANGTLYHFWYTINYGRDEPIDIRMVCEKGTVLLEYNDAVIKYSDGTIEENHRDLKPTKGKDYWGNMHANQISNFYGACLGLEKLDIDGEEALKTHRVVCAMYDQGGLKPQSL